MKDKKKKNEAVQACLRPNESKKAETSIKAEEIAK
jgi:hypothetical protein